MTTIISSDRREKIWSVIRVSSGNFLEMYDFFVFGYYATAIGKAFFPTGSEFAQLMLAFMTFGAGFLMRPLGGIFLGTYIDHYGRRAGLMLTLGLMAIGTVTIALVPGYATLGVLAPVIVVLGRLIQGFSAGVELGGVSVYLAEIATPGHKGFYVSWQSGSQQVAVIFVAVLGVLLSEIIPPESMMVWGWRIPFLIGCLIIPLLFILRSSLQETDEFEQRRHAAGHPKPREILLRLGQNWRIVIIGMLLVTMTTVSFYFITAYTPTLWPRGPQARQYRKPGRDAVRGYLQPVLAAGDGRRLRPGRPPAGAAHVHDIDVGDRLSCLVMAGQCAFLCQTACGRAVALVHLRELQRRDGGGADRDRAAARTHRRVFRGLQSRDCDIRRLHPRGGHLSVPRH